MTICDKKMSFEECELAILRNAVDTIDKRKGKKAMNDPDVSKIISIVEDFLKSKKLICYGGTAINNILPVEDQFYNKDIELPDYDFYSPTPLEHAKELADIYYNLGFEEVIAQSGVHAGTFKVFVNYIPVADITHLPKLLFNRLAKETITVNGIHYCSANYLRMNMFLELSRPAGDVSRWEKVLKRLSLLNKHYPLKGAHCNIDNIQRLFQYGTKKSLQKGGKKVLTNMKDEEQFLQTLEEKLFFTIRDSFIKSGCVFFGAFANRLYLKNLSKKYIPEIPDFDVLSEDPETTARILKERLHNIGVDKIDIIKHDEVGEMIEKHYEVRVGPETIAFIYKPISCHSYNIINLSGQNIRIATLDTMLTFYLAFTYAERPYYDISRLICMSEFLFKVQQKNRLSQKGILKRFSIDCYGKQPTLEMMRAEKSKKFKELKDKRGTKDYEWYFLRYVPKDEKNNPTKKKPKKKTKKRKNKIKKKKTKKRRKKRRKYKGIFKF